MKKMMIVLVMALGVPMSAWAVWPPSTTLDEEAAATPAENIHENLSAVSERAELVVDKLNQDEQRLAEILKRLEKDQSKLKPTEVKPSEKKEDLNGHSLH